MNISIRRTCHIRKIHLNVRITPDGSYSLFQFEVSDVISVLKTQQSTVLRSLNVYLSFEQKSEFWHPGSMFL